ncbi:hypothetical protein DYB31_008951 [Aphanomyces astaci]|uniref:EF-hand domain-containing protein n=1 Tax=Aphanomyces astaci TaxID=112090 RepID=A0A397F3L9_APHAT|nr:hypothetical protein DYB31_008951 [Aphanomyces astaci]
MTCEVKIGVTKCIDCDEPYCDDCFAAFHKQGARANHRAVTMEFQAMHLNLCMCRRCHVRATARVCEACKMGLCVLCFEKVHSMRSGLHNHPFRRPIHLQQDPKHRLKLKKKPAYLSQLLCSDVAQVVMSQHGWPSKSSVDAAAAAADKVQRDAAERESHIQAICRTLEKPVLDAFKLYDPDYQGYVGVGELRMLLTHELCIPVTKNEICDIVASIDLNHDGHLGIKTNSIAFNVSSMVVEGWNEILRWLAIQIVDGTFRGTFRAVRTKALHVHKGYRKTQQHIRDVKRKLRDRWPKVVPRKKRVPPYDDVFQLHPVDDFQSKKHVFYRFLQHGMNTITLLNFPLTPPNPPLTSL